MTTRVGFSTPKMFNPVSWLVRMMTASRCSHTWFLYHDIDFDMEMVMEAHELGFRLIPYEHFKKHNIIVKVVIPASPIDEGLREVAQNFLGTAYNYAGLIGMAVVAIGRFLKLKWKNPLRTSKNVFCSQAVAKAMLLSPGYAHLDLDPDTEEPEDLMRFFEEHENS